MDQVDLAGVQPLGPGHCSSKPFPQTLVAVGEVMLLLLGPQEKAKIFSFCPPFIKWSLISEPQSNMSSPGLTPRTRLSNLQGTDGLQPGSLPSKGLMPALPITSRATNTTQFLVSWTWTRLLYTRHWGYKINSPCPQRASRIAKKSLHQ